MHANHLPAEQATLLKMMVDVQIMRVGQKQVTLSLFRQLPSKSIFHWHGPRPGRKVCLHDLAIDAGHDAALGDIVYSVAIDMGLTEGTIRGAGSWEDVVDILCAEDRYDGWQETIIELNGEYYYDFDPDIPHIVPVIELGGTPWGIVNYRWADTPDWAYRYLVWQESDRLYRMPLPETDCLDFRVLQLLLGRSSETEWSISDYGLSRVIQAFKPLLLKFDELPQLFIAV